MTSLTKVSWGSSRCARFPDHHICIHRGPGPAQVSEARRRQISLGSAASVAALACCLIDRPQWRDIWPCRIRRIKVSNDQGCESGIVGGSWGEAEACWCGPVRGQFGGSMAAR
jgi:hypothetical protein